MIFVILKQPSPQALSGKVDLLGKKSKV